MKTLEPKTLVVVWVLLMLGFGLNLGQSQLSLGFFNVAIALGIAFLQMLLVLVYFMHLRYSTRLTWLFAASGFYWLGVLFVLGLNDYLSRGWLAPR